MRGFSGLSDFFLRKAFKFALKRNLGKYLASELDTNQLDVQLGQGTIELRQLLLNCNELNEQLNSPYWEITAGFIGSVKATIPITTLSIDNCQAALDEILITIKPKRLHHPSVHDVGASGNLSASNVFTPDSDDQTAAQDIMTDGIMQIAGGIETVVQQLQLQATRATIRVELPSVSSASGPPSLVMIHVDSISYSGDSSTPLDAAVGSSTALALRKRVLFEGLQVELFQDIDDPVAAAEGENVMSQMRSAELQLAADLEGASVEAFEREAVNIEAQDEFESSSVEADSNRHVIICSSDGIGCSGQVAVCLTWPQPQQIHPHIAVDLDLNPLQLQLHPHHLPLLSKVLECLNESSQQAQHAQHNRADLARSRSTGQQEAGFVAGARSCVESTLLPNCERLAQDFVDAFSWNSSANPVPANSVTKYAGTAQHLPADDFVSSNMHSTAFHDAHSMMGSVGTTFNSFLSATATSLGSASSSTSRPQQHLQTSSQGPASKAHHSKLSQQGNVSEGGPLGWEVRASCGEASVVLWYPEEETLDVDQGFDRSFSCDYGPRFCMETSDLALHVTTANDAVLHCKLSVHRLECAEHLPVSDHEAVPAAATLAEITRVPDLLPPFPHGARPVPSFTGVSPLPFTHSLYSSTLSQLASSVCGGSRMGLTELATSAPQVQVWPVLCAAGGSPKASGTTPSVTLSMHLTPSQLSPTSLRTTSRPSSGRNRQSRPGSAASAGEPDATAVASVQLRPSTVWLSLPLLQRLQAFFEPLVGLPAATAQQSSDLQQEQHQPCPAVSSGIESILEELQDMQIGRNSNRSNRGPAQSTLHVSIQAPHVCAVVLLPPLPPGAGTSLISHGNSYMAVDLFSYALPQNNQAGEKPVKDAMLTLKTGPQNPARQFGVSTVQSTAREVWEGDLAIGRAKVFLVKSSFVEERKLAGLSDSQLQAHCILDIASSAERCDSTLALDVPSALSSQMALSANVTVTPGIQAADGLIELAWQGVLTHSKPNQGTGAHLDNVQLQAAAMTTSSVTIHIKAPKLDAKLCQADLAAVVHLVGALNAWQAESQLANAIQQAESDVEIAPIQVSLLLECGMNMELQHVTQTGEGAGDTECSVKAEDVRIFNVSSLGGVMESGALSVYAEGVTLTGGQDRGCLLHCPAEGASPSSPAHVTSALEFWQVIRPIKLEDSRLISPRPGQPATLANSEGIGSLLVKGTTFATDAGNLTLPWLTDLAHFFDVGGEGGYLGVADAPPPIPIVMTWGVALQDVAVRYEPSDSNSSKAQQAQHAAASGINAVLAPKPVSAILSLAGLQWRMQPDDEEQRIVLQCLALHCAESSSRKADWTSSYPQHVPAMQLAKSGYFLLAQEFQLEIALKSPGNADSDFFQTEISNQRLSSSMTKTQLQLLTTLMSQWTSQTSQSAATSQDESGSGRSSGNDPDPELQVAQRHTNAATVEWQGMGGEGQLRVMDGVQEDAFRKAQQQGKQQNPPDTSVFLEGGWFPPEQADLMSSIIEVDPRADQVSTGGNAPNVTEDYICPSLPPSEVSEEWDGDPSSEDKGIWYGDPNDPSRTGPNMEEDYVQLPVPGNQGVYGSATGRGAIGPLSPSHPAPLSRIILRDLKLLITLNQEEEQEAELGHAHQAEPNNGRLEIDLEGVSLQLDTFKPHGSPYAWRLAFSIHQLEVRDHVKKSGGKPPRWRRMLGYHFMARTPRHPAAVMLQIELEAVRPDGAGQAEEEYRLAVALLPLRLRIDQNMVVFLQAFFAASEPGMGKQDESSPQLTATGMPAVQPLDGPGIFLQKVDIQAFSVVIDYQPRRLDAAALKAGSFVEVLNLVPWGGVQLDLPHVKATGLHGWPALASAVGNAYLQDIALSQVHKFVVGVAPVRSLCRVGWAAKQLLSIPADQLRNTTVSNGNCSNDVTLTRQLRRGVTSLARAITLEALGLGASVAGGADFVLRGGSGQGSEHPAGLKEGLKQAAHGLSSGLETAASALVYSPVRSVQQGEGVGQAVARAIKNAPGAIAAPAAAAAAATRSTFLGMRNALDPERYEERSR